jgi:hypothetical protein
MSMFCVCFLCYTISESICKIHGKLKMSSGTTNIGPAWMSPLLTTVDLHSIMAIRMLQFYLGILLDKKPRDFKIFESSN